MREWLTVIVVLLIVGILLDGWRRMRNARRDNLRVAPRNYRSSGPAAEPLAKRIDDDLYTSELPNGGARVVAYRESPVAPPTKPKVQKTRPIAPAPKAKIPQQVTLNLDEAVPLLMESVEEEEGVLDEGDQVEYARASDAESGYDEDHMESFEDDRMEPSFSALDDGDTLEQPVPERKLSTAPAEPSAPVEPEEVLIINVMAPEGERLVGQALLDVVLECGMRYGSMDIFHRHSDVRGDGTILFSMANMVKPGTFDLDAMEEFTTPGVSLFMTLPLNVDSSLQAFELMLDSARRIADTLGGELKDENRSVMTRQTMEHCRERIRDFERKQMSRVPH